MKCQRGPIPFLVVVLAWGLAWFHQGFCERRPELEVSKDSFFFVFRSLVLAPPIEYTHLYRCCDIDPSIPPLLRMVTNVSFIPFVHYPSGEAPISCYVRAPELLTVHGGSGGRVELPGMCDLLRSWRRRRTRSPPPTAPLQQWTTDVCHNTTADVLGPRP